MKRWRWLILAAFCAGLTVGCSGCGAKRWPLKQVTHYDTRSITNIRFDTSAAIELMAMLDGAIRDSTEDARCLLGDIASDTLHIYHAARPRIYERTDSSVSYGCRRKMLIGKAHVHLVRDPRYFSPAPSVPDVFDFFGDPQTLIRLVVSRTPRGTAFVVFTLRDGRTGYVEWLSDSWR